MPIITISRQPGTLGEKIAEILAQKLNLNLIGQEQIRELAQTCDEEYEDACLLYEEEKFKGFFKRVTANHTAYRVLFEALNLRLASQGHTIIIGRAGQKVLAGFASAFHIRLIASQETKVERIMQERGITAREAEEYIITRRRRANDALRTLFDLNLNDANLYDLILNTSLYTAEQVVEIICQAVELRQVDKTLEQDLKIIKRMAFAKEIEAKVLKDYTRPPVKNFKVTVENGGKVKLAGFTGNRAKIEHIVMVVKNVEGVTEVNNKIKSSGLGYAGI